MKAESRGVSEPAETSMQDWGIAALSVSIISTLLLLNICIIYFSFLRRGPLIGSYVDGRGGLWEMNAVVPALVALGVLGGVTAFRLKISKRAALCSAAIACSAGVTCFVLTQLIRGLF